MTVPVLDLLFWGGIALMAAYATLLAKFTWEFLMFLRSAW